MEEELLGCTLTVRHSAPRTAPLTTQFASASDAVATWLAVLLHEARAALDDPLDHPPPSACWHAVDVHGPQPGIVDRANRVVREAAPRTYRARPEAPPPPPALPCSPPRIARTLDEARHHQADSLETALQHASKRARQQLQAERRAEKRREETPEQRAARLEEARAKRRAAADARPAPTPAEGGGGPAPTPQRSPSGNDDDDDASSVAETGVLAVLAAPATRTRKPKNAVLFASPVPHHRHLCALERCRPHPDLVPALLHGARCDALHLVQGPPGTGKTRALLQRLPPAPSRVFLCAPTNVGAAHLYELVVHEHPDECALVLAPERVPAGTLVASDDPSRRIVCATVSSRAGRRLDGQSFTHVFLDEAAQCMEAWAWTLLRPEVECVVMAGDVRQLPALVSDSGRTLKHDRSLMERLLVDLDYEGCTRLTVQHRMAPALLRVPNALFYENALTTGAHAPPRGTVEVRLLEHGAEAPTASRSWRNAQEAEAAAQAAKDHPGCILLTPYLGQCQLLLSKKTGREVHTVDSFQGREADTVVLSLVRDGSKGSMGFWEDPRRLTVALTRARTRLIVLASKTSSWPPESWLARTLALWKKE